MKIDIHHACDQQNSYRAACVKSMFNVEDDCDFRISADLDIDTSDWQLGLIVGPSGSGKSSLGAAIWGEKAVYKPGRRWPVASPIIDAIAPEAPFNTVTAALSAVGLGSVPTWLRPYKALSTGEKFRADLARLICSRPTTVVIDEFTSVVDRQVARIGSAAFAKAWRRGDGQAVLLSCHKDIIRWLQPDWIYDTSVHSFTRRRLRRRPKIELEIHRTDWSWWAYFQPHHYLKLPPMIAAACYIGAVNGHAVAHVGVSTAWFGRHMAARAARLVVLPEWQGVGIGQRFLSAIAAAYKAGQGHISKPLTTYIQTSHPGLAAVLRRHAKWSQVSANLVAGNKARSHASMVKTASNRQVSPQGYGGHFRALQGFRYDG